MKSLLPLLTLGLTFLTATSAGAIPVSSPLVSSAPGDAPKILWKGRHTPVADIGKAAESIVGEHLARYLPWVAENGYHIALTDDARVLLIASTEKLAKRRLKLVTETLKTFDEIMPAPDRSGSEETFRGGDWGVREHVPDAEPVVLIEVDSGSHYQSLLGSLEESEPNMQTWTSVHASEPGFDEVRVLAAAWQSAPDGFEIGDVWRSENELVNRLSRLLTYRSFGPQPTWLSQAVAWDIEQAVMGDIYCFPYRDEFVSIAEHSGWKSRLRSEFKKRKDRPLELAEFADWKRGTWDLDCAAGSWGFVQFLAKYKPGALTALAEANRIAYKAGFTEDHGDGTWSTHPAFQVSQEAQLSALRNAAGPEVMDEATEYFRTWKKYKPSKRKRRTKKKGR